MAWVNTNPTEAILESDDVYWQAQGMHSYEVNNGRSSWTNYEWCTFRIREKVWRYAGVTEAQAATLMQGDTLHVSALTANGTEVFEDHSIRWSRRRSNECGAYDVIKMERWTALYVNGVYVRGAALSVFPS